MDRTFGSDFPCRWTRRTRFSEISGTMARNMSLSVAWSIGRTRRSLYCESAERAPSRMRVSSVYRETRICVTSLIAHPSYEPSHGSGCSLVLFETRRSVITEDDMECFPRDAEAVRASVLPHINLCRLIFGHARLGGKDAPMTISAIGAGPAGNSGPGRGIRGARAGPRSVIERGQNSAREVRVVGRDRPQSVSWSRAMSSTARTWPGRPRAPTTGSTPPRRPSERARHSQRPATPEPEPVRDHEVERKRVENAGRPVQFDRFSTCGHARSHCLRRPCRGRLSPPTAARASPSLDPDIAGHNHGATRW